MAEYFTKQELTEIRTRFNTAQTDITSFANWICQHMLDDFRWLLGALDGLVQRYEDDLDTDLEGKS